MCIQSPVFLEVSGKDRLHRQFSEQIFQCLIPLLLFHGFIETCSTNFAIDCQIGTGRHTHIFYVVKLKKMKVKTEIAN
jgi:hypothetical protein